MKLVLEGGTDVAEMVLFSLDDLPASHADDESLSSLEERRQAIRMPTGADGGYLLHLYVDEGVPPDLEQYCNADDALKCQFQSHSGRVAFGGAESTFRDFKPNANIRADGSIEPGTYAAVAYRTEYPDDLIEDAVEAKISRSGASVVEFPGTIVMATVVSTIVLLIAAIFVGAAAIGMAAVVVVGGIVWFSSYTHSDKYKSLLGKRREVESEYPSIVVEMIKT